MKNDICYSIEDNLKNQLVSIQTPYLKITLDCIVQNYKEFQTALSPYGDVYYSIKANPIPQVIKALSNANAFFDIASKEELDIVLSQGVFPNKICFGNTIKKIKDIEYAYQKGIRLFASDAIMDLKHLREYAPESQVFFRLVTSNEGAQWPLSFKFGTDIKNVKTLIKTAIKYHLEPVGVSFHVGSQQQSITQWKNAILMAKSIFEYAQSEGIKLSILNLGGGFCSNYIEKNLSITAQINEIKFYLEEIFDQEIPKIMIEPGRAIVADSGIIKSQVLLIADRPYHDVPWLYLDVGLFNGLMESMGEAIKYPLSCSKKNIKTMPFILAGPTCDSLDVIYQNYHYQLPVDITAGDYVYFHQTGAYTYSYSSVEFNGYKPLKIIVE